MKIPFHPAPFVFACVTAALLLGFIHTRAQETNPITAVDTSKLFIVQSPSTAFMITTYNRIFLGTWLEIRGKDASGAQSVTVSDNYIFAPAEVRIVSKHEPAFVKKEDGTWEITFKEVKRE